MKETAAPQSIWKLGRQYEHIGLHDGPQSKLSVGSTLAARYTPEEGVHFFFEIEQRPTASYTLAEMKKIHRHLGYVLDKIDVEPSPTRR